MRETSSTGMELQVLGAGPAYTDRPGALGSSYLVSAAGASIALDLGQGVFPSLAATIEPSRLAAVVVSHLHPDHWIDLVPLRHYLRYEFAPSRRLTVLAPGPLGERLDALHGEPGFTAESLDVLPLAAEQRVGPYTVSAVKVTHTADSHALRVEVTGGGMPGLVYSGDCGRAMDLAPLVRPGDTLLAEVSFGPGPVPVDALHLDGPSIGELARVAQPRRILLTHLQMGYDPDRTLGSIRAVWDGPVSFVVPGDRPSI